MRTFRIKNLRPESLVHIIIALKGKEQVIRKAVLDEVTLKEMRMSFTTVYGSEMIETVIELKPYDDECYKIVRVTVGEKLIYGSSPWRQSGDPVLIDAE